MATEILSEKFLVSIVSPVYNASNTVEELITRIQAVCQANNLAYEIILVDDNSRDDSWNKIKLLSGRYPNIKGYRLSRNFGQHYALTAGLSKASGNVSIIMDCDLQDNPDYIPELLQKQREGFDVVCTIKAKKKHSPWRTFTSNIFFWIINNLSDVKLEENLGGYTLLSRNVVNEFLKINDYHRHSSLIIAWLGFKRGYINVEHNERFAGKSSYSLRKLIAHAINGVISQSAKILLWSIYLSIFFFFVSIAGIAYIIIKSFESNFQAGWPSLFVLILFSTATLLFTIGVFGLYLGKIFEQVKDRPLFIISEEAHSI